MNIAPSNPSPRLLITGATGFIGSRFVLHAHRQGLDVVGAGREGSLLETERADELRSAQARIVTGVLQDPEYAAQIVAGRDTVIHLAAAQHESAMPESYFRSTNVEASRVLLEACARAGVRRVVFGSTIGVYGAAHEAPLDEHSTTAPDNMYTRTKLEAETLVRQYAHQFEITIVRIPETYGPGDYRLLKLFRALERGRFLMIGDGQNRRQCLHVQDLIRGLLITASHPAAVGETFVFAGREVITTSQMVQTISRALHREPPALGAPLWPFMLGARVMETLLPPLHIEPPLHTRRLDFFRKSFVFNTAKAQRVLGFTPEIDFRDGAADTARWYRLRGLLPTHAGAEFAHTPGSA